ncbi:MAG: c-type cytochrome [Pseudomonadota bacterium]
MKPWLAATFLGAAMIAIAPAALVAAAPPSPAGQEIFEQRCASCHSVEPGENDVGPGLAGVVGRKAGSLAGFDYSPALKTSGKVWTPAQLDQYLAAPQKLVPGTRMAMAVPAADQRQAIIAYLAGIH